MVASNYVAAGMLRDGTPVRIRAIHPDDKEALRWGFTQLSPEAIYQRFFQTKRGLTEEELAYLTELDFKDHVALVAEVEVEGLVQVVAVGRFVRLKAENKTDRAEVAFTVGDEFQGRGIGTLLLEHLVRIGRELGYTGFEADVLPGNRLMREVFEHSGLLRQETVRDGVVHVEMGLGEAGAGQHSGRTPR